MPYIILKDFSSFSDGIKGLVADDILPGCNLKHLQESEEDEAIKTLESTGVFHTNDSHKGCIEVVKKGFYLKQLQEANKSIKIKQYLVTKVFGDYGYLYFGWLHKKDGGFLFFVYTEIHFTLAQPWSTLEKRQRANEQVFDHIHAQGKKGGWRRKFYSN